MNSAEVLNIYSESESLQIGSAITARFQAAVKTINGIFLFSLHAENVTLQLLIRFPVYLTNDPFDTIVFYFAPVSGRDTACISIV